MHFRTEEWADFARGRVIPAAEEAMQAHLNSGCSACQETLRVWQRVIETAGNWQAHEPPERGVRLAKSLYHLAPPQKNRYRQIQLARLAAPLFAEPFRTAEGLRTSELSSRHFLFQDGELLLDVQVELRTGSGLTSLAGQVISPDQPGGGFAGKTITLMRDHTELARATTNYFGEFHLEFRPVDCAVLAIDLEGESLLIVPLPSFIPSKNSADPAINVAEKQNNAC